MMAPDLIEREPMTASSRSMLKTVISWNGVADEDLVVPQRPGDQEMVAFLKAYAVSGSMADTLHSL